MSLSWALLGVTLVLLAALAAIAIHAYRRDRAEEVERPKHRMLEDD